MKKNLLIAMIIASATILKAQTTTGLSPKPPMAKTTDSLKKGTVIKPTAASFSKFRLGVSGVFYWLKLATKYPQNLKTM